MKYSIIGDNLQMVVMEIQDGEELYGQAGSMVYMSANMDMQAKARGGILKGLGRKLAGESFFMQEYRSLGGPAVVSCSTGMPGKVYPVEISPGMEFMAQKTAFLVAESGVEMSLGFQKKIGAAIFGGEGLVLQKFNGNGTVFVAAFGDFVEMNLAQGQTYKVDTGCVVGFDSTVTFDIQRSGSAKTMLFGGEGLFVTTLTGPGRIILQSGTLRDFAFALMPLIRSQIR